MGRVASEARDYTIKAAQSVASEKTDAAKVSFFIGVEICLESQETTLQGLAIAMCPHGESGLPAGDL